MKRKYFLLLLICTSLIYSQSIKNRFTHFTEKDGLPANVINSLMQDHLGYIWIATTNGVTKYDGFEFENFTVVPKDTNFLQEPLTTSLYEDSKGNIWIGSVGGVSKYDRTKNSFRLYSFFEFSQKYQRLFTIFSMQETRDGNILCGAIDFHYSDVKNGLFEIDVKSNKVKEIIPLNDDSTKAISQISPLGNDKYLISGEKGFAEYDYTKNYVKWHPFKRQMTVISFLQDENDNLWLGTYDNGLIYYNVKDSTYKDFPIFNELLRKYKNLIINKIIFDQKKNLFLATNEGLMYFNVNTKELFIADINPQNPSALHSPNINNIILDNSGSIWIANNDAGISKYDIVKNNFQAYTAKVDDKYSISPGWVSTIFGFNENEFWLKSSRETLDKFYLKEEKIKREQIPKNFEIFHILKTSKGKIFLAGSNGFYTVDPVKWEFQKFKLPIKLNNNVVYTAIEIDNRTIWFGTTSGLYIYDEISNATTNIDFNTLGIGDATSNSVTVLTEDKNKNIWIGTNNGLFKFDINTKLYSRIGLSKDPSKSFTTQDVNSLYVDNDNNLWIGTWLGGLNKYYQKNGSFESFTQKDGLPSHSVQGILGDEENGYIWLSTFNGISRFDLEKKTFTNFGVDDGIQANQFADGSALKTSKGLFVFGGSNGMTVFNPKEIQNNLIPPQIEITDFKLFGKSVLSGDNSPLKNPIYETKKLILNYDENDIELDYFAAHYVDPKKNQYAYKLENYEDDWRYVGNQRSAIYPNLPPGDYIFHLKAANNNEVWNDVGVSINIEILAPWWKTWWAYTFYIFAFMGFLFAIRKAELKRQKKNSEIKESELRAEAAESQAKVIEAENQRKTKELEGARLLQLSMLPKELPKVENLEIAVYMKTATEVGGDYYDFRVGLDGTLNVAIGDATGHGLQAGTLVTIMKGIFTLEAENYDVLSFFHKSVKAIKEIKLGRLLMAFAFLKIRGNQLSLSNAGVPPVYIFRENKNEVEEIDNKGMPLGAMSNYPYKETKTELNAGDVILLLSDGFPELTNKEKESFGYERVIKTFKEAGDKSAKEIIEILRKTAKEWSGLNVPDDDITFVVIKVK